MRCCRTRQADHAATGLGSGQGSPFFLAAAGRRDAALTAFRQAIAAREPMVLAAPVHPRFRSLRADPGFVALFATVRSIPSS
ncbi:MAG: hypothetical protein R2882_07390 [Gemmatimonadales bacterium]